MGPLNFLIGEALLLGIAAFHRKSLEISEALWLWGLPH